ncbi:MAG: PBPRA1643 family SWIM/SEC-C metal-binding motif protein [Motiliproteus sp.]
MSDKFFFKGRQDTRLNHSTAGYQTKASHKTGTKKFPLTLVVTSEARKQEIEALVAEAKLYANISIDNNENAVESIAELTALLNKEATVTVTQTPARNEPCSCGSGKKYKKCCG